MHPSQFNSTGEAKLQRPIHVREGAEVLAIAGCRGAGEAGRRLVEAHLSGNRLTKTEVHVRPKE